MVIWAWVFVALAALSFLVFDNPIFGCTALIIANVQLVGSRLESGQE